MFGTKLGAIECLKKFPWTYDGENGVPAFSSAVLIGTFSYSQVAMTYIRACMSLKLGKI